MAEDRRRPAVLYASYDGVLEPLGQSQVVAYLARLADAYRIHLVTFEKPRDLESAESVERMRSLLQAGGIAWHPLRYHKRPPVVSTLWDMGRGALKCWSIARQADVQLFHGRNILCAAMLYPAMRRRGGKLLADIRGFWADERVDGGIIRPGGMVYKVLKVLERAMLRAADHIVTLTQASVPHLRGDASFGHPTAQITVIPTCADMTLFQPRQGPPPAEFTLGYVGQVGTWYLLGELIALFLEVKKRRPSAKLLIVNQHQHATILDQLRGAGIGPQDFELVAASREEVPALVQRMTFGASIILPAFSKISSCPTKLAEYLGCGVPCIGNSGVGDVAEMLDQHRVGVVLRKFTGQGRKDAVDRMFELMTDEELPKRCRETAERHFSLQAGVDQYRGIYRQLTEMNAEEVK